MRTSTAVLPSSTTALSFSPAWSSAVVCSNLLLLVSLSLPQLQLSDRMAAPAPSGSPTARSEDILSAKVRPSRPFSCPLPPPRDEGGWGRDEGEWESMREM